MREILFRAWHKQEQKMYPVVGMIRNMVFLSVSEDTVTGIDVDQVELVQYTGLRDVAGKKIFEGDILGMENATAKVVFWERPPEFGLDFHHNEDEWCEDWNLSDDHGRMEIIGNAYEHPELLEAR
jgi:hypothetical protein